MKSLKIICIVSLLSITSLAASMSTEDKHMMMMHEKMAKMHTMAVNCMKAGKSMDTCHDMMMKNCKMGEEKCKKMMSMMDDSMSKMMGEGLMDDGMMTK